MAGADGAPAQPGNNPCGKTSQEQDEARGYPPDVEHMLRRAATLELDGRRPVAELAATVEELLR